MLELCSDLLWRRLGALVLMAAGLVLALPLQASATGRRPSPPDSFTGNFGVPGVNLPLGSPAQVSVTSRAPSPTSLNTGTVKVRGVELSLNDSQGLLTVNLVKRGANYNEGDFFSFGAGVAYSAKQNLSEARMHGAFARHGVSVNANMTFHATAAAVTIPVSKGCKGKPGRKRKGVLKGTLRFKAGLLGTLTVRSFRATLEIPPKESCPPPPPPRKVVHAVHLSTERGSGRVAGVYAVRFRTGKVFEGATVSSHGPIPGTTWLFLYFLSAGPLQRADYTYAHDLSRGMLTGAGPFHGSARYSGSPKAAHCSSGTLGGDLTAHFVTLGTVTLFPHGPVKAQQCQQ